MLLVLASIFLMTLDHKQGHLENVRSGLQVVVYPIRYLVHLPVDIGRWLSESLSSRQKVLQDNASLRAENTLLQARLQKFADLEAENRRLRALLDSSFKVVDQVLIAELYRVDLDPYKHLIVLNKGSNNSVYVDQPILDAHGVMGQIIQVGPLTSTARLITDPSHVLPVQVNRNGLRTVAVGTGNLHRLELPYLPNNAEIQAGDLLVTSGLGRVYPPGYPVATVLSVTQDPGSEFAHVEAQPLAHLDRSREVLLVWSGSAREDRAADTAAGTGDAAPTQTPAAQTPAAEARP